MAVRLGYDTKRLSLVCHRFAQHVMQTLRRQTKREHGLRGGQRLHPGLLLVVQRFRSDLGLYVHVHALAMDGCFEAVGEDDVRFLPLVQLSASHLVRVLDRLHRGLAEHLEDNCEPPDEAMAACVRLALSRAPRTVLTEPSRDSPMLVSAFGMQLHAGVTVDGRDRKRLERVCRQVRVHFKARASSEPPIRADEP